jgi:Flp pilus assembly protein TadG
MVRVWRRRARSLRSCRCGGAAVEFALVMPLLLALLAGVGVLGICLGAAHNLRLLAAEAARASVAGTTDAERAALARGTIDRSLSSGAMFRPGSVAVQVGADADDADLYTVTVTLDAGSLGLNAFSRLLPLLPNLMRSTVSVRRGGL